MLGRRPVHVRVDMKMRPRKQAIDTLVDLYSSYGASQDMPDSLIMSALNTHAMGRCVLKISNSYGR